jgi:hypothetical protein
VYALVTGGGSSVVLQLYDDGKHGDGKPDDGLYANNLTHLTASGGYAVKLVASGQNNSKEAFTRYASTGFNVRRRVTYIWKDDLDQTLEYRALLEEKNWLVNLLPLSAVTYAKLQPSELIIIGPDTGYLDSWGTNQAINAILESSKPVLGLGEGGYAFFGKLKLSIGWPNGAHDLADSITWAGPRDPIWDMPYNINLDNETLQLYKKPGSSRVIYLLQIPGDVTVFGYRENDPNYAALLQEEDKFTLWGFADGPGKMTETGQRLFTNTVFRSIP